MKTIRNMFPYFDFYITMPYFFWKIYLYRICHSFTTSVKNLETGLQWHADDVGCHLQWWLTEMEREGCLWQTWTNHWEGEIWSLAEYLYEQYIILPKGNWCWKTVSIFSKQCTVFELFYSSWCEGFVPFIQPHSPWQRFLFVLFSSQWLGQGEHVKILTTG